MNNKYVIAIEETLVQEFDISANNAEEAFRKAVEYYKNGTSVITQGEVLDNIEALNQGEKGKPAGSPFLSPKGKHGIRLYV